jgi:quercetin dioxygenase-like cupin family protein
MTQQQPQEDSGFDTDRRYAKQDYENRLAFKSDGWMVSNVNDHASFESPTGRNYVLLSSLADSRVVTNCYEEGAADEMHCHPGSDRTFLVWEGQLHLTGVEDGEELTLKRGEFVQIKAGYYYQLHNPGPGRSVYCQFQTVSPNPPKRGTVLFSESRRDKAATKHRSALLQANKEAGPVGARRFVIRLYKLGRLTLGVLRRSAGLLQTVLLGLLDPRVTRQETVLPKLGLERRIRKQQRPSDPMT